jgi:hypothetical protein
LEIVDVAGAASTWQFGTYSELLWAVSYCRNRKGRHWLPPFVTIPCCVSLELPVDCFAASLCSVEYRKQEVDDYDVGQGSAQREGHA